MDTFEMALDLYREGFYLSSEILMQAIKSPTCEQLILYSDSLHKQHQYKKAIKYYQKAIEQFKIKPLDRYIQCLMSAKEYFTAKTLLEKLDQKSLKNFKQLAEIYECNGEIQKAIDCHKEILKHNNCSIETITTLLDYGVSLNEIDLSDTNEFIKEYVLHYSQTQRNEFDIAIQGFTAMDQKYKGNCFVLNMLGETLIKSEDLQSASQTYKKVLFFNKMRRLDPEGILGMDRYAMLLREAGSFNTLQRLSEDLMGFYDSPQSYIAQSFVSEMKQDYDQALLHIDKAILLNPRHYFSHQVRARILFALGKFGEASMSYRNAYKVCRDITTYEGLVKCYLKLDKVMEATSTAKEALSLLPSSSRAVTLAGKIMSKNPQMQKKAKTYLEKAFKMNPKSLESLLSLAEYYQTENTQKAIDLLNENLQYFVCDLIHRRLGDLYFCIEEWKMASDEYQIAININPENHEAKKGLSDVERAINGVIDDEEMSESGDDMEVHSVEND